MTTHNDISTFDVVNARACTESSRKNTASGKRIQRQINYHLETIWEAAQRGNSSTEIEENNLMILREIRRLGYQLDIPDNRQRIGIWLVSW
jgi:hypothetical protein